MKSKLYKYHIISTGLNKSTVLTSARIAHKSVLKLSKKLLCNSQSTANYIATQTAIYKKIIRIWKKPKQLCAKQMRNQDHSL